MNVQCCKRCNVYNYVKLYNYKSSYVTVSISCMSTVFSLMIFH